MTFSMSGIKKKIVLAGAPAVGKTSLIRRYVEGIYSEEYLSTIGTVTWKKEVSLNVNNDIYDVILYIIDTNGTISNSLFQAYSKGANGVILAFDLTRRQTLNGITSKLVESTILGDIPVAVVGNKFDLITEFENTVGENITMTYIDEGIKEKFNEWMQENHKDVIDFFQKECGSAPTFEPTSIREISFKEEMEKMFGSRLIYKNYTSAKTGYNVDEMFESVARKAIEDVLAEALE